VVVVARRTGKSAGVFSGSAMKGNKGKVGIGKKVNHFNSGMPGGNGKVKSARVTIRSNARGHGKNGNGIVTGATSRRTPGSVSQPGQGHVSLPATGRSR
jgi:hypothetical protein